MTDGALAVTRGMRENAADYLRSAAIRPDVDLTLLTVASRGIGPAVNRFAFERELLRSSGVAEDGVAGRIGRVQLQQLPALGLGGPVRQSVLATLLARGGEQKKQNGRRIHWATDLQLSHHESE